MTVCGNCGTAQGPFSRKLKLGPVCAPTAGQDRNTKDELIVACNKRRQALDNERHGKDHS